eukprot:jgi/Bigna1/87518/estExt_fgenesh1_pg.C_210093
MGTRGPGWGALRIFTALSSAAEGKKESGEAKEVVAGNKKNGFNECRFIRATTTKYGFQKNFQYFVLISHGLPQTQSPKGQTSQTHTRTMSLRATVNKILTIPTRRFRVAPRVVLRRFSTHHAETGTTSSSSTLLTRTSAYTLAGSVFGALLFYGMKEHSNIDCHHDHAKGDYMRDTYIY